MWQDHAACRDADPELFYPDRSDIDRRIRKAKAVCATCPVTAECLDYALDNGERFGVWGGLSERERRKLRRRNAA